MARRKKGRHVSGWLILDKPVGLGSTKAVSKVRWLFDAKKAGHAGTLDPLASGLLPIALGEATKTVNFVMDGRKTYEFSVEWGAQTTTDDKEGEITAQSDMRPKRAQIEAILPDFLGEISQIPPSYSAIKIDGERAYSIARSGENVELEAREVTIDRLEIMSLCDNECQFVVDCTKGTYVRSLARDIGAQLGCYGHVSKLRRTAVGDFNEDDMISMDELLELEGDMASLDEELLDILDALDDLPQIEVSDAQAIRVRSGNPVLLNGRDAPLMAEDAVACCKGEALAIGFIEAGHFHPRKVFVANAQ